jgi:hypothetical protein
VTETVVNPEAVARERAAAEDRHAGQLELLDLMTRDCQRIANSTKTRGVVFVDAAGRAGFNFDQSARVGDHLSDGRGWEVDVVAEVSPR